ncbi:MAG: lytic transglycosylase domain-containing protein [Bdellovibrio sp.]
MKLFKKRKLYLILMLTLLLLPGFFWRGLYEGQINASSSATDEDLEVSEILNGSSRSVKISSSTKIDDIFNVSNKKNKSKKEKSRQSDEDQDSENSAEDLSTDKTEEAESESKTVSEKEKENESENTDETTDTAPSIKYALDKIEDTNKGFRGLFGFFDNLMNRNCEECEEKIRNMRFMQCNSENDYLNDEIKSASKKKNLLADIINAKISSNSIIKPACIQMGMTTKFGAKSKNFRECSADNDPEQAVRPCVSEKYFKLVNNSFNLVSQCMKDVLAPNESKKTQHLDVRAVYALINVESGFHINAMSSSGASGIGQFTQAAIEDVNENELFDVRTKLSKNSNPDCGRLSNEMLSRRQPISSNAGSCDRISIKNGNPVKNMIYTFAYLNIAKKNMDVEIFNNRNYKRKFDLSNDDLNKIKRALMVWSHNTGPAGTWTPAKALLNTVYHSKRVTDADEFIRQLQQYMQKVPARANRSRERRRETSHYFPAITKTLNDIEQTVGGGSCVNF